MFPPVFAVDGQKSLKGETARGKAGHTQRGNGGAWARDGTDWNAIGNTKCDHILARIGNGGRARIGHQRAGFAGEQPRKNFLPGLCPVVIVVADERLVDAQVVEQLQGDACVLGTDEIGILQRLPHAGGNVLEVSNGSGNQIKRAGHGNSPFKDRRRRGNDPLGSRHRGTGCSPAEW